jgi:hypothetical protein
MRSRPPALSRLAGVLLLVSVLALPGALPADDVYLLNGNSFEGVVAVVDGDQVRIRMTHGELTLPMTRVERIERQEAPLERYLARKAALTARAGGGTASDWLELGRWAASHGLDHNARESAVQAARRDPRLDGLADLLEPHGYVFDADLGRWLARDEHLRRRGWAFSGGRWWSPEEQETYERERRIALAEARERRREVEERRLAELALENAVRARVDAEVARELAEGPQPAGPYAPGYVYGGNGGYGVPVGYGGTVGYGGIVVSVGGFGHDHHGPPGRVHGPSRPGHHGEGRPDRDRRAAPAPPPRHVEGSIGRGPVPGRLRSGRSSN